MKRKGKTSLIFLILLLIFIGIQFVGTEKSKTDVDPALDYFSVEKPPEDVAGILKSACYDCHSHDTQYPWYAFVAPVSWWIQGHIDHAIGHLNFSEWVDYSAEDQEDLREEIAEEVKEGHMPLKSYTWLHSEARMSEDERSKLVNWFKK